MKVFINFQFVIEYKDVSKKELVKLRKQAEAYQKETGYLINILEVQ